MDNLLFSLKHHELHNHYVPYFFTPKSGEMMSQNDEKLIGFFSIVGDEKENPPMIWSSIHRDETLCQDAGMYRLQSGQSQVTHVSQAAMDSAFGGFWRRRFWFGKWKEVRKRTKLSLSQW